MKPKSALAEIGAVLALGGLWGAIEIMALMVSVAVGRALFGEAFLDAAVLVFLVFTSAATVLIGRWKK